MDGAVHEVSLVLLSLDVDECVYFVEFHVCVWENAFYLFEKKHFNFVRKN